MLRAIRTVDCIIASSLGGRGGRYCDGKETFIRKKAPVPKTVLRLPDPDQAKSAVLRQLEFSRRATRLPKRIECSWGETHISNNAPGRGYIAPSAAIK